MMYNHNQCYIFYSLVCGKQENDYNHNQCYISYNTFCGKQENDLQP